MGVNDKVAAIHCPGRECCDSPYQGEHIMQCRNWEPPLTVEELRHLRHTILAGIIST
jgi:hypothetical protein